MPAMLALILIVVGAGLFAAGFIVADVLVWVGGLLIVASVLGPLMFPAKA